MLRDFSKSNKFIDFAFFVATLECILIDYPFALQFSFSFLGIPGCGHANIWYISKGTGSERAKGAMALQILLEKKAKAERDNLLLLAPSDFRTSPASELSY